MKQNFTLSNIYSIGVALLLTFSLTQCGLTKKNCCGYKGPIVADRAISLYAIDHFIPKDTIEEWTDRFEANKGMIKADSIVSLFNSFSSSYSFNGYYACQILCNKESIGIRVLIGMDVFKKLHVILVGIKPDYTTLYIPKPGAYLSLPKRKRAIIGVNSIDEEMPMPGELVLGGLQFSQKP